MSEDSQRN